ncbi:resuscitation-promoting factor [Actinospica robiniae]|uniref:resuscitation-promoting factor n=1 Tax=Actinospica robiniae TaxID=304901 RepID=UPI00040D9289|nr:resuscitation-promoting factor [Actinospica robiniae]
MSGTRSNPPHGSAYGPGADGNGGYAAPDGRTGSYPGHEGTSEAAEYYYEDQYNQQQYPYDPYAESSAEYFEQAPYGAGPGYQPDYPAASYEATSFEPGVYPETGYAPDYPPEYGPESPYGAPEAPGRFDGHPGGYPAESGDGYGHGGLGAPMFGAAASFTRAGTATATATDLLTAPAEAPSRRPGMPGLDPSPDEFDPTSSPARRGRARDPETAPAGSGRKPPVLRTRPRTGPLGRIVQGTVLAALVAGAITYVALDKSITLTVDGQTQTVHTFAGTVGAVLTADGISTGSRDIVTPAVGTSASDGATITVRYGRQLSLSVNGVQHTTWVHYPTVGAALGELGVRTDGARSNDALTMQIPRSGLSGLSVYTMRHVTFLVDGKTVPLNTTAATVSAAISQAGIALHNQDAPSVPAGSVPQDGQTISVNRIQGTTETKQVSIPYNVSKVSNASAYAGTSTVKTAGVDGEETVTYALLIVNGKSQAPKAIKKVVTKEPVDEVLAVGTKALPTDAADLNWAAVAKCESGGNPAENTGNGFYGMYQFSEGTWLSLGGTGYPYQASAAEQTDLAELLYERSGSGQWPVCGHLLFT